MKIQKNALKILYTLLILLTSSAFSFAQTDKIEERNIQFKNGDTDFAGKFFLPGGDGPFPGVVILHGGSSRVKAHRATSSYYGQRFAMNGICALIYDKRGTGDSGGEYSEADFDDFINDALSAVKCLKEQDEVDSKRVGILGPSQGGRIAALAAARSSDLFFIATLAAPLVSISDLMYFTMMDILQFMKTPDSLKTIVSPLWKKHFSFVEKDDKQGLHQLDLEIDRLSSTVPKKYLPWKSDQIWHLKDIGRADYQPQYNSMANDYISELAKIKIPWLNIYAEFDRAVPVDASIKIMKEKMASAGNKDFEIKIIPNADHSFRDVKTKKYCRVEQEVIDWIHTIN